MVGLLAISVLIVALYRLGADDGAFTPAIGALVLVAGVVGLFTVGLASPLVAVGSFTAGFGDRLGGGSGWAARITGILIALAGIALLFLAT